MRKRIKVLITLLALIIFVYGCGNTQSITSISASDKEKAKEAIDLYNSYRDGINECQEIMSQISSVSREIDDAELAKLVAEIVTLMPFEDTNGTDASDNQISKIKEYAGLDTKITNSPEENSSESNQIEEVADDENNSSWEYYADANDPQLLKQSEMLSMPLCSSTYTNGFQFMVREDFEDVSSSSFEDWIKVLDEYPNNSFCQEFKRILNTTDYYQLNEDEKAFLDWYIRFDSFTTTRSDELDKKLGKVIGDVYIINYNDRAYYTMDNGKDIAAPREMVFNVEGLSDFGYKNCYAGAVYFTDFKNPNTHCVYRAAIGNDDWNIDPNNKYISAELDNGLALSDSAIDSAYNDMGFMYITNTAKAKTLGKYDNTRYNEIIEEYSELIEFMRTFSDEAFLPYLIAIRDQEHQKFLDEKAEKEKWENAIPAVGMTKEEVLKTKWGSPDNKNITNYTWGTKEQWVYDYRGYVYFEDGIVIAVTQNK